MNRLSRVLFISFATVFAASAYAAPGDLDTSFNGTGQLTVDFGSLDRASTVIQQADGKLVVAGYDSPVTNNYDAALMRINSDGTLDSTFGVGGKITTALMDKAASVIQQADGKLVAVGYSFNGSTNDFTVMRYNSDGSLDTAFSGIGKVTTDIGISTSDGAGSVLQQPDGKLVVAGSSSGDFALVRYNSDGSLDATFDGDGKVITDFMGNTDSAYSIIQQSDGKLVVTGFATIVSGNYAIALVRYNSNGSLDASFDGDGKVTVDIGSGTDYGYQVIQQANGKLVVAGYTSNSGYYNSVLVRLNSDGSLDTSFDTDGKLVINLSVGNDEFHSLIQQADEKLLATGNICSISTCLLGLVRFNGDGTLDNSFGNGGIVTTDFGANVNFSSSDVGNSLIQQMNGVYVVAGYTQETEIQDFAIARYIPGPDTNGDGVYDIADTDNDGMPNTWETRYGLNPLGASDANGDLDGDNILNVYEYQNGTDPTVANVKVRNDFDLNGKADVLLRNVATGDWNLALLNGLTVLNQSSVGAFSDVENVIVSIVDFNGDGAADILTRGTANGFLPGTFHIDLMSGMNVNDSNWLGTMSTDLDDEVVSTKDFNKDGKADVLLRNKTTGVWTVNYMNGVNNPTIATLNATLDTCYTVKGDGDYDGNGYPDLLLRKDNCGGAGYPWLVYTTDGDNTVLGSGAPTGLTQNTGWGALVTDKDFNGDGKADVVTRALSGSVQQWLLANMNGTSAATSNALNLAVQSMWQFAADGDFNADNKADILIRSTITGQWYAYLLDNATPLSSGVVNTSFNPIWTLQALDDNNGDGKSDILLRNSADGSWRLNLMNGLTVQTQGTPSMTTDVSYVLQND